MFYPNNGEAENPNKKTEVKILYNDEAVYVGATMYDDPNNVLKEIKLRDEFGASDHFGVFFNGFNDNQLEHRFFISAAGVQLDAITTSEGEDYSWDAIWECKVNITSYGWVAEFKIPYAALRFSDKEVQTWGLNMFRDINKDNTSYCWNFINSNITNEVVQAGILEGIEKIEPPTRLFFIPYTSYYHTNNDSGNENQFKAGMDIKYGINDSFTLDAILVPDFGQVTFDNVRLVLGPFEQQFIDYRPFFTEGTDLFNKGNMFYSRRIGGEPALSFDELYYSLPDNEDINKFPSAVNLINATKISGRTKKGLGIGFLNAVTEKTSAEIINIDNDNLRDQVVEPLANYNVFVLDQRFRGNSSVSFINTNVLRNGFGRDANVSGLVYDLNTKSNSYKLFGDFKFSYVNAYGEIKRGTNSTINFADTKGKFQYGFGTGYISKDYDHNDLGIIFTNNYYTFKSDASFRTLKSTKNFNSIVIQSSLLTEFQNTTGKLQTGEFDLDTNFYNLKNDALNIGVTVNPFETFDFYFPGIDGRFNYNPKSYRVDGVIVSNNNRKYSFSLGSNFTKYDQDKRNTIGLDFIQQYRFNNKLYFQLGFRGAKRLNDIGLVDYVDDAIIYAKRDVKIIKNTVNAKYSISDVMNINLKVRYYWAHVLNNDFLTLRNDGYFDSNSNYNLNKNLNRKIWNFDLSYSWWFAPGSLVSVLYRNNSLTNERVFNTKFVENFKNALSNDPNNTISISVRYYLDYNKAAGWFNK
ncbi:DUF5916 domain-containing protein [Flavobacterium sp.]|uniref:DUF5916 domain-containing protein n=1 Tax=Flavobacterium sp. TaxID=239 RepID=UPI003F695EC6